MSELTDDKNTDYLLWKATRSIKRPVNGRWARNSQQKAVNFANLEQTFQPNKQECDEPTWTERIKENLEIALVTPKEVIKEIKENINPKKAPGFDLITGEILKQLPRKAIVKLTTLINTAFRLKYVPKLWKVAEVIMIPKPGKPPHEVTSYRPISLLPVISKLFEKLLIKRIKPIIEEKGVIPSHQFGFRNKHSTIDQVHRITNIIENALEKQEVSSTIFLDVAQAFDKVWHKGLMYKLKQYLPKQYS